MSSSICTLTIRTSKLNVGKLSLRLGTKDLKVQMSSIFLLQILGFDHETATFAFNKRDKWFLSISSPSRGAAKGSLRCILSAVVLTTSSSSLYSSCILEESGVITFTTHRGILSEPAVFSAIQKLLRAIPLRTMEMLLSHDRKGIRDVATQYIKWQEAGRKIRYKKRRMRDE